MRKNPNFLEIENQGPVRWISLNRPEVKNAFNLPMGQELLTTVTQSLKDKSVAVLVLSAGLGLGGVGAWISVRAYLRRA